MGVKELMQLVPFAWDKSGSHPDGAGPAILRDFEAVSKQ